MDCGALGDGANDDSIGIQKALDSGNELIIIPPGNYKIGHTLTIGSNTRIVAHAKARLFLADRACLTKDDFLVTNKNHQSGDVNISIKGGVWDGNNLGNPRGEGLFNDKEYTGVLINFINVNELNLSFMKLCEPESFYLRLGEVNSFSIHNIIFESNNIRPNQDGVHLGGYCSNGRIYNLKAENHSPNDDFIAINADDIINRVVNLGMKCGPINNLDIRNIEADDCHSFVRMLSINSLISNIYIDGVSGGCNAYAVNLDAARYCRTPLFDDNTTESVGNIENVSINNMSVHKTSNNAAPLILIETNVKNFEINHFSRNEQNEKKVETFSLSIGKIRNTSIIIEGIDNQQAEGLQKDSISRNIILKEMLNLQRRLSYRLNIDMAVKERLCLPRGSFDRLLIR